VTTPIPEGAVLAGTKALDAAYGEAKKAKQQLDGKGVAKTRRAANMRRRKRSGAITIMKARALKTPSPATRSQCRLGRSSGLAP